MMTNMHEECPRCKIPDRFYAEFNSNPKRNVAYFGIISYTNYYYVIPSEEPKEKLSTEALCFLRLENEWKYKQQLQKSIEKKKKPIEDNFNEDKNLFSRCVEETPDSNQSFHESSSDDKVSSDNLETTNDNDKLTKKNRSKKKTGAKEPKLGTLKRKRWNWDKLQPNESYEDDLFEEKKLKHIRLEESNCVSKTQSYSTPCWSVQLSPKEPSTTPCYEDCYSPSELQSIRKEAEEYQYRRNKRRKHMPEKTEDSKTEMKGEPESYRVLEEVRRRLEKLAEKDCGLEEDFYFANEGEFDQGAE